MKSLLFTLVFALLFSVNAIGITVPDRQTPDLETMKIILIGSSEQAGSLDMAIASCLDHVVMSVEIPDMQEKANLLKSQLTSEKTRITIDDGLFNRNYINIEILQEAAIKSTWKPYRMLTYKYRPSIKPPLIQLHRV
jgi:hypothetical protein